MDNVIKAVFTLVFVTLISMFSFIFAFRAAAQAEPPVTPPNAQVVQLATPAPPGNGNASRTGLRRLWPLNGVQFGNGWRPGMGMGMMDVGMVGRCDDRWDPLYNRDPGRCNDWGMRDGWDACAGGMGNGTPYQPSLLPDDGGSAVAPEDVSFAEDIQPILNANCIACHGGSGGLFLDSYENVLRGGVNGPVIMPGDPSGSRLIQYVSSGYMPLNGQPLSQAQVETLANWVAAGAPDN